MWNSVVYFLIIGVSYCFDYFACVHGLFTVLFLPFSLLEQAISHDFVNEKMKRQCRTVEVSESCPNL